MAGPIINSIKRRFPRIGGALERGWDAAFDAGGEVTLPANAEVVHENDDGSVVVETTPAITVKKPKGFMRSRTVWAIIVLIGFQIGREYGLDLPDIDIAGMILNGDSTFTIINAAVAAYFRAKATNLTRG